MTFHYLVANERYVEVPFRLVEGYTVPFYYGIGPHEMNLQVHVMEAIPPDVITDAFILSAHFNSVLNSGKV